MSSEELFTEEPDTTVDPYAALNVPIEATEAEIRSAYKKLALKHHPDKVAPNEREAAHKAFQQIAFAYAILSDSRRRKRYDTTGNTAESALDDEDFDWGDFFRARYTEITRERIEEFEREYKGGDEEKRDVLKAYEKSAGRMERVYQEVMLSNMLEDEDRFQKIIRDAIDAGELCGYDAFLKETARSKQRRMEKAKKEASEAEQHAKELGLADGGRKKARRRHGDLDVDESASSDKEEGSEDEMKPAKLKNQSKASKKKTAKQSSGEGLGGLAAMIQQRQQSRATSFLDDLEAKYAPKSSKGKKRKPVEEPPEEAFVKTGERRNGTKKSKD